MMTTSPGMLASKNGKVATLPEPQIFAEAGRPIGDSGLNRYGGYLYEDLPASQISGARWFRAVRDMTTTSPVISGMLFAVEMMIRKAEWILEVAGGEGISESEAEDVKDFVDSCRYDMRQPWEDTLAQILSFLPYGYAIHEIVLKRRMGDLGDPLSGFDDGRIGWDEWAPRAQETITRWVFDDSGHVIGVEQQTPSQSAPVVIPLDRCLHFKAGNYKGSPEGKSVLRAAYADWDAIRKIQMIEAIGIERDLAGLPVAFIPPEYMSPTATDEQKSVYRAVKRDLAKIRNNEQAFAVFPLAYEDGKPLFEFKLMASTGSRQFDTGAVINRRASQMTMVLLADFLTLGHTGTGTYALSADKTRLFTTAITAWLDLIANVINDQAIKPLVRANGWDGKLAPTLRPGPLDDVDLSKQGAFFTALAPLIQSLNREDQLALAGYLFDVADWPEITTKPEELPRTEKESQEVNDERIEGGVGGPNPGPPAAPKPPEPKE